MTELPIPAQKYPFSPHPETHIIYRLGVVREIVKHFQLDYTGISSLSFNNIAMDSFVNASGVVVPVAVVSV
jgi:hypothetical protein